MPLLQKTVCYCVGTDLSLCCGRAGVLNAVSEAEFTDLDDCGNAC